MTIRIIIIVVAFVVVVVWSSVLGQNESQGFRPGRDIESLARTNHAITIQQKV